MRRPAAKLIFALLFVAIVAVLLEFSAKHLIARGVLKVAPPIADSPEARFYDGTHPIFGVWHVPNAEIEHPRVCFKARYASNSVGARDRERERESSEPRTIFLGDSFIEGWGLEAGQRLTDRLERATGIEQLNFGMSFFGPYQSLLAYQHLAKLFDHSAVIIAILPENDFVDIDLDLALEIADYSYRYRPYLRKTADGYERFDYRENRLRRQLRRHSYAYAAFLAAVENLRSRLSEPQSEVPLASKFYEFTDEQFDRLEFIVDRLADEVDGKPLAVLLLPTSRDFAAYQPGEPTPLAQRFDELAARRNIRVVDLLPSMAAHTGDWARYSFSCDYHWSSYANWVAARIVSSELDGWFAAPDVGSTRVAPVDRVELYPVVRDRDGEYVVDLGPDQFQILEDRALQEIVGFSADPRPLRVALVVDASARMLRGDRLARVKKEALRFLDTLNPGDEALVISFGDSARVQQAATDEKRLLAGAIRAIQPSAGSALYDAVWRATQELLSFDGRRVVVLLSAGRDEAENGLEPASLHVFDDVVAAASRHRVMIFPIALGANLDREHAHGWPASDGSEMLDTSRSLLAELREWAASSGGRIQVARNTGELREVFSAVAADLAHQYSLSYVSSHPLRDGVWREIDISTPGRALEVTATEGYFAPRDTDPEGG